VLTGVVFEKGMLIREVCGVDSVDGSVSVEVVELQPALKSAASVVGVGWVSIKILELVLGLYVV
jgi:hypothetical protein